MERKTTANRQMRPRINISGCCHFQMAMVIHNGMKDVLVPIDQAGRIVLPKGIRQDLGIKPGDVLKVSIRGSAVTLSPNKEVSGLVRKGKALVFSTASEAVLSAGIAAR